MRENDMISGVAILSPKSEAIPLGGLKSRRLRVELQEMENADEAWLSELVLLDDLPWLAGEERDVQVRIASEKFRSFVVSSSPNLRILYGNIEIGTLTVITSKSCSD